MKWPYSLFLARVTRPAPAPAPTRNRRANRSRTWPGRGRRSDRCSTTGFSPLPPSPASSDPSPGWPAGRRFWCPLRRWFPGRPQNRHHTGGPIVPCNVFAPVFIVLSIDILDTILDSTTALYIQSGFLLKDKIPSHIYHSVEQQMQDDEPVSNKWTTIAQRKASRNELGA